MRHLLLSGLMMLASLPAWADLTGDTLEWDYYAYGSIYQVGNTWVVPGSGGNFGLSCCSVSYFNIFSDATSISFDYTGSGTWSSSALSLAPTNYNGIAINLDSGAPFTSVTIDPATNMAGFNASRISFTANQIQVDWQNLSWSPSTVVTLDVNASTPEPAAITTFALLLAVLCWYKRKHIFARG